jgi:hypothetical protein
MKILRICFAICTPFFGDALLTAILPLLTAVNGIVQKKRDSKGNPLSRQHSSAFQH